MSAPAPPDRFAAARAIADAVLYEGYVLYPYRASARKNQLRWQFGVLAPPGPLVDDGSERSHLRTTVLVDPGWKPVLHVRVRGLQVQHRTVERMRGAGGFVACDAIDLDGATWVPWDEAVAHELDLRPIPLRARPDPVVERFTLAGGAGDEMLTARDGQTVGRLRRVREEVASVVRVTCGRATGDTLLAVGVEVRNETAGAPGGRDRDAVLRRSLVATHVLLGIDDGAFVSLLDPPPHAVEAVRGCVNDGAFPVVAGPAGTAEVVLASPIILYDHPEVAGESVGEFCDGTEIDEMLALRVLTLTEAEKAEARGTDARAAAIVERTEAMAPDAWARLHGAVRSMAPAAPPWWDPTVDAAVDPWRDRTVVAGRDIGRGTRVVLRPSRRADAQDLFLAGQHATVAGVFHDVDGAVHLAVALDGDPGADMVEWQRRYRYFHPDEVEVLDGGDGS